MENRFGYRVVALLAMGLLVSGCWMARGRRSNAQSNLQITIEIHNNNWNTIVVYGVSRGHSLRMGEVVTGSTLRLKTPSELNAGGGDFQIVIDPIGSSQLYRTGRIPVFPGGHVSLRVENNLSLTTFTVS